MSNWSVFRMFSKSHSMQSIDSNQATTPEGRDFSENISLLKEFEERRKKLCKELKKLSDCLNELNCNEKQLLEELNSATINDLEKFNHMIERWAIFINEVNKNREDLSTIFIRTSIEPLKKFQIAFNEMQSAIKRYEQLTSDHAKYSEKVKRYKECDRTSTVIIKFNEYQSKLAQSQSDLSTLRSVLERELPMFIQKRVDYLQPSLAAFISSEILYSGNNLNALDELKQVSDELSDAERTDKQNKLFDSIDNLSIVTS